MMPAFSRPSAALALQRPAGEAQGGANWRHRAACLAEDPELFFPVGTLGPAAGQAEEAKTVCRRCPVLTECLTWALETGVEYGVWGGQTQEERRSFRRRRARGRTSRPV